MIVNKNVNKNKNVLQLAAHVQTKYITRKKKEVIIKTIKKELNNNKNEKYLYNINYIIVRNSLLLVLFQHVLISIDLKQREDLTCY